MGDRHLFISTTSTWWTGASWWNPRERTRLPLIKATRTSHDLPPGHLFYWYLLPHNRREANWKIPEGFRLDFLPWCEVNGYVTTRSYLESILLDCTMRRGFLRRQLREKIGVWEFRVSRVSIEFHQIFCKDAKDWYFQQDSKMAREGSFCYRGKWYVGCTEILGLRITFELDGTWYIWQYTGGESLAQRGWQIRGWGLGYSGRDGHPGSLE